MEKLSRTAFLQKTTMAAMALLLNNLKTWSADGAGKKIKIAITGCGSVSGQYLPHLVKSPWVELVSCCDIIPERAAARAREFEIPNVYAHIDQLLSGPAFDLMLTLTDMQEHGRLNRQALLAGRHVWSEKPLANSYREGKALVELARSKNLRIWGAPAVVNSPQFAFMSRAIQQGRLGRLAAAHGHYGHTGPSWSAFFYEKGGGSMPDLGVYNLATLTGLLGPAIAVSAMTSIVTPQRTVDNKGSIKVEAEDNAMIIMQHANSVLSHVQCGFNYFDPHGHEGKGQTQRTISIWGDAGNMGLIGYDWAPLGVEIVNSFSAPPEIVEEEAKGYVWQEGGSVIAEALATGIEPRIAVDHALHVLEIIEAARNSSRTGKRINLESRFEWPMLT